MGTLKRRRKKLCLSLRASYVAYMLTAVVLSTLLCSLLLHLIDTARMQNAHRDPIAQYEVPENGFAQVHSSGDSLTITFFGPDGQASGTVRERPGEDMYVLHSTEDGAATIDSVVVYPSYTSRQRQLDAFYDIADGVDAGSTGLSVDVGFDEASFHGDTQVMSSLCRSFQVFGRKCRRVFRDISKFLRIQEQSRSVWLSAHCTQHVLR